MQIGSIVEVLADFTELARTWGFVYPKKGELLTVIHVAPHCNTKSAAKGNVHLWFDEYRNLPFGLSLQAKKHTFNFVEVVPPISLELEELLNEKV